MNIIRTAIPDVLILEPKVFGDARGFFMESWNQKVFDEAVGHPVRFVQDNHSRSSRGVLRGLHYQLPPHAQGKLVRCGRGRLLDVAVDARKGSPTYGQWVAEELSFDNGRQLWIPAGFLHGFATLTDDVEIIYKCTDHYAPECDGAVRWDSLGMNGGIDWGVTPEEALLSPKDAAAQDFATFDSPFIWERKP